MNALHGKIQNVNKILEQHAHNIQIQFTFSNNGEKKKKKTYLKQSKNSK